MIKEIHFHLVLGEIEKLITEYYDLVYEYKYDCLTAGIKYNKKYYSDGDLKPSENLFFSITLFPLTNYEYDAKEIIEN